MGAAVGSPGARARRAARPAPGAAAGGRAVRGAVSTIAQQGTSADNKSTRLGGGQDNGELSDVAQKYGTTPGTASAVFPRLGYTMACGANNSSRLGPVYTKIEPKATTLSRQDTGELGNMAEQHGTTLDMASAIFNRLGYHMENGRTANTRSEIQKRELQGQRMVAKDNEKTVTGETLDRPQEGIVDTRTCTSDTGAPERDTPPKQGEKDTWYSDTGEATDKQRGRTLGTTHIHLGHLEIALSFY